jgi:hypothetical protein
MKDYEVRLYKSGHRRDYSSSRPTRTQTTPGSGMEMVTSIGRQQTEQSST